jgi:hypothetical protein
MSTTTTAIADVLPVRPAAGAAPAEPGTAPAVDFALIVALLQRAASVIPPGATATPAAIAAGEPAAGAAALPDAAFAGSALATPPPAPAPGASAPLVPALAWPGPAPVTAPAPHAEPRPLVAAGAGHEVAPAPTSRARQEEPADVEEADERAGEAGAGAELPAPPDVRLAGVADAAAIPALAPVPVAPAPFDAAASTAAASTPDQASTASSVSPGHALAAAPPAPARTSPPSPARPGVVPASPPSGSSSPAQDARAVSSATPAPPGGAQAAAPAAAAAVASAPAVAITVPSTDAATVLAASGAPVPAEVPPPVRAPHGPGAAGDARGVVAEQAAERTVATDAVIDAGPRVPRAPAAPEEVIPRMRAPRATAARLEARATGGSGDSPADGADAGADGVDAARPSGTPRGGAGAADPGFAKPAREADARHAPVPVAHAPAPRPAAAAREAAVVTADVASDPSRTRADAMASPDAGLAGSRERLAAGGRVRVDAPRESAAEGAPARLAEPGGPDAASPTGAGALSFEPTSSPARASAPDEPAATPDVRDPVVAQVVARLRELRQDGRHEISLRLDPPDLGGVTIDARLEGARLTVHIRAEHGTTQELLADALPRLRESLAQQGFVPDRVSVELGFDSAGGGTGRDGTPRDGARGFAAPSPVSPPPAPARAPRVPVPASVPGTGGGLDVWA